MNKFFFFFFLLLSIIGEISATEFNENDAAIFVYNQLTSEQRGKNPEMWAGVLSSNQWLVTVDYNPSANWGHSVFYYYIETSENGDNLIINNLIEEQFMPSVSMTKMQLNSQSPKYAETFIRKNVLKRDISSSANQYVIILSGGWDKYNNYVRYWNDCSFIYSVMRNYYNVPADNIFVSMSDGTNPDPDLFNNQTQPLDLDGDGVNDIRYAATLSDLEAIFQNLEATLTQNDHLFLYVIDHGAYDDILKTSYICLWNYEKLYPTKLNEWLTNLNVGSINCVFGQCFSGGFINELQGKNRIIATACDENEYSYATLDLNHDAFVDAWTSGLMNPSIYNGIEVECADYNGDNFVSMDEAFNFALYNDEQGPELDGFENPQFNTFNERLSRNLCFDRLPTPFELVIRDNDNDNGIEPNMSAAINNSPDIWIRNSDDNQTNHQNPIFTLSGSEENYIYVKIHNMGLFDYVPGISPRQYLHLNWSKGAPTSTYGTFTGQYIDNEIGRLGSAIKSIFLNEEIPAGGDVTICIPWKSHGYESEVYGGPLSILASISNQPYGLAYDVTRGYYKDIKPNFHEGIYTRQHKGMAIKNLFYPNITEKKTWNSAISLQGLESDRSHYSIRFQSGNSTKIFDKIKLTLTLPKGTFAVDTPDSDRSAKIQQRVVFNPDSIFVFTSEDYKMQYIGLDSRQFKTLSLKADIIDDKFTGPLSIIMSVEKYPEHEIVGTYTFNCSINRGNFSTLMPRTLNITEYEEQTLSLTASKSLDKNTIKISLNNSCDESLIIHINSLNRSYLGSHYHIEPGQKEFTLPISEFSDDIIVISLEKNDEIVSTTTIK